MANDIRAILTHINPDLDAIVSCWLLKRYGKDKYPKLKDGPILFCSANKLPGGKNSQELYDKGILSVDVGSGILDTHVVDNKVDECKIGKSASLLVAEDLGIDADVKLRKLLDFCVLQDTLGRSLKSKDPVDHTFAVSVIIKGLNMLYGKDNFKTVQAFFKLLDGMTCDGEPTIEELQSMYLATGIKFEYGGRTIEAENILDALFSAWLLKTVDDEKYKDKKLKNIEISSKNLTEIISDYASKHPKSDTPIESGNRAYEQNTCFDALINELVEENDRMVYDKFRTVVNPEFLKEKLIVEQFDEDHYFHLFNFLRGMHLMYDGNINEIVGALFPILDGIRAFEKDFVESLREYEAKRTLLKVKYKKWRAKLVFIESSHSSVMKVARLLDKADMIVHKNPSSKTIGITTKSTNSPLQHYSLELIAKKLRVAECIRNRWDIDFDDLEKPGEIYGWYLHQTHKILSKGSQKADDVPESKLSFEEICNLVYNSFNEEEPISKRFDCPQTYCIFERCSFYPLRLDNCRFVRFKLKESKEKSGER